ncbi:MAG TPA: class I fructose-bisphosphate aldolase [Devosia sp.]
MTLTAAVRQVLSNYGDERPGIRANLARMLMHGATGGSGKLLILPVDQGFEHGPARSFAPNPPAYDPLYHFELAIAAGVSAYAAPLGALAAGAGRFAGEVPLILKANSANALSTIKDEAITGTVRDALELGCAAIGFTIYPGSDRQYEMFEEVRAAIAEARTFGLPTVLWAYPRGGSLSSEGETALDVVAYGAQIAAQLGAHIIKVKIPSDHVELASSRATYQDFDTSDAAKGIAHVVQSAFAGRRLVVFSGGALKERADLDAEVQAIIAGGGSGSIIGRNSFQRPLEDAVAMLRRVAALYVSGGPG